MSKILEALDCLKIAGVDFYRSIETYVPEIHSDISETQYFDNTDEFYTIKQGLLEAQELEKENSALLEENNDLYVELTFSAKQYKELVKGAEQYIKALEIIFEKSVDIEFLKSADTVDEYNTLIKVTGFLSTPLTQDEFDLLKEYSKIIEKQKEMLK